MKRGVLVLLLAGALASGETERRPALECDVDGTSAIEQDAGFENLIREADHRTAEEAGAEMGRQRPLPEPRLRRLLSDSDPRIRVCALIGASWSGDAGAPLVPDVAENLRHADRRVRSWAATALRHIGPAAAEAAPDLVLALMAEPDAANRVEAAEALVYGVGEAGERALLAALRQEPLDRLERAFGALDSWGRGACDVAMALLERAIREDRDPTARRNAAELIARLGDNPALAVRTLVRALLEDADAGVRAAAARALKAALRRDANVRTAAEPALREAANDPDGAVRRAAARALMNRADEDEMLMKAERMMEVATAYEKEGRRKDALELYRDVLKFDPEFRLADQARAAIERLESR